MLKVFTLRKSYVKISETDRTVCFTHETQVTTVLPYSTERERERERRAEEERQAQRQAQLKRKRDRLRERERHTHRGRTRLTERERGTEQKKCYGQREKD